MMNNSTGRIAFLDVAKVIVTFLVVFGHLYSPDEESVLRKFIYTFHMPFFFLISGFFHKDAVGFPSTNLIKYEKKIIYPALFFIIVFILIIPPLFAIFDDGTNYFYALFQACKLQMGEFISTTKLHYNQVCWFLFCLFWCKVYTDILKWRKVWGLLLLIIVLVICYLCRTAVLYTLQAVMALPFYYLGTRSKMYLPYIEKCKFKPVIAVLLGLLCFSLMCVNGRVSLLGHRFGTLPMPLNVLCFYFNALVGSLMILLFSASVRKVPEFVTKYSRGLITVVGLQAVFFHPILHWFDGYHLHFGVKIVCSLVIMLLCYGCHRLLVRYVPLFREKEKK